MSAIAKARKTCSIAVFLFGKPAWELDLENYDVNAEMVQALENLGDELKERLHYASNTTKKLMENGWTGQGGLLRHLILQGNHSGTGQGGSPDAWD
jgi:hypothetical protein